MHSDIKLNPLKIIFLIINFSGIILVPECVTDLSCLWHSTEVQYRKTTLLSFVFAVFLLLVFITKLIGSAHLHYTYI